MTVASDRRFTVRQPCPVCGGHSALPHGQGRRCWGFLSDDGAYAHCTRPELARELMEDQAGTFAHRLVGACRCGRAHSGRPTHIADAPGWAAKAAKPANDTPPGLVLDIWRGSRAAAGTLVEHYLASRALTGPVPPSLRFAPRLRHAPSEQWLPAMVAAVTVWPGTLPVAVHRTYICSDGAGKANVMPSRMALGPVRGGAVRLGEVGDRLSVSEGIETALSLQMATELPAWAALSASNLPGVVLPPLPLACEVVIGADPDPAGLRAAHRAAEQWRAEGRRVRIAVPPAGCDFNDVLRRGG